MNGRGFATRRLVLLGVFAAAALVIVFDVWLSARSVRATQEQRDRVETMMVRAVERQRSMEERDRRVEEGLLEVLRLLRLGPGGRCGGVVR